MKKSLQILGLCLTAATAVRAQDPGATVGSTGSVTFNYAGQQVTLTSVRAADGKIWLQQNLGSSQVATAATDTASYGHLFQWGRWIDGHQLRNSSNQQVTTLTINNPSGISGNANFLRNNVQPLWWGGTATTTPAGNPQLSDTWSAGAPSATNGTDPCAALGAGWHMPTNTEWLDVRTAENITSLTSGFSSNLKLPYSGYRNGANGGVQQSGYANLYWTSSNYSVQYPYVIYNGAVSNNWSRGYGASCRCVKTVVNCTGTPDGGHIDMPDTSICPGNSLGLNLSGASVASGISYQWQSRPVSSGNFADISGANTITYIVSTLPFATEYRCKVTCTSSSDSAFSDTVAIGIATLDVQLGNDTTICNGNALTLDAGNAIPGISYVWSDNSTAQTLTLNSAGTYWAMVNDVNGCSGSDTINVSVLNPPAGDSIIVTAGNNMDYTFSIANGNGINTYDWQFGDNSAHDAQASPVHTYTQQGTYIVTVVLSNECGDITLSKSIAVKPTGITETDATRLGISLYPNPTQDYVYLEFHKKIHVQYINLSNVLGQEVLRHSGMARKLNVQALPAGTYYMRIQSDNGSATMKVSIR
jgi:hypothetical protein